MASEAAGYIAVFIATLFFGSNFVPVKRYETFDGMYYQWVMCSAIWMVGLLIQLYLFASPPASDGSFVNGTWQPSEPELLTGRPDAYSVKFMPMAALGGALWATGNTMSVPVINMIGLSLGLLIWGSANMLMGWATGVFGLFVGHKDVLASPAENYIGLALAVVALMCYTQVKTADDDEPKPTNSIASTISRLEAPDVELLSSAPSGSDGAGPTRSPHAKLIGVGMAVAAGILFGNTFTPPDYLRFHKIGPTAPLDYVFSHFTGIFATSTFWFVLYCIYMRGAPKINARLTLPGLLSGAMWAVAQTCWFIANDALSVSVAFPIITSGPGIISALWGVFVFKEITGVRNYIVLCIAIALALTGCILIGLSK